VSRRALGLLPLAFFAAHLAAHARAGTPAHMLWMCHLANLALGAGLLLDAPALARVGVLWLLPGLPLWASDVVQTGELAPTSALAHLGGLAVGLAVLPALGVGRRAWSHALGLYILAQLACRAATPASLNVNVAHRVREGWEGLFPAYWQYWLFTTSSAAACLWALGRLLAGLFPSGEGDARRGAEAVGGAR
jgi:hypothetical protein